MMASEDDAMETAAATLGEHFENYAIVVQHSDGSVDHVGNNDLVERALYEEALYLIKEAREWEDSDIDIEYDDDDDDDWMACVD